jgi:hypothetical protein
MNIQARIGATGGRLKNRRHNSGGGVLLRHVCVKIARYAPVLLLPPAGTIIHTRLNRRSNLRFNHGALKHTRSSRECYRGFHSVTINK